MKNQKTDKNPMIFLLGGKDLEMLEIEKILRAENLLYVNKNLSWGASWKDYEKEIEKKCIGKLIVGIELSNKDWRPNNSIDIDHHNEGSHKKSSIEQLADLLDVKLDRWQQLVAANDAGYIPGMLELDATESEISAIRKADRAAQGVTEEEEEKAEASIANHLKVEDGLTIVYSLGSKFSPITDRLYGKADKLLVYTDAEVNYYGSGINQLAAYYSDEIKADKAYHGGGNSGFFGWTEALLKDMSVEEIIVEINRMR